MPTIRQQSLIPLLVLTTTLLACGSDKGGRAGKGDLPAEDAGGGDVTTPEGGESTYPSVGAVEAHGLATSETCMNCHNNNDDGTLVDSAGRGIAPFDLWSSTMKANSARDPFFRAVLSAEKYRHPELTAHIEDTCLTCHAPMGKEAARRTNTDISLAMATEQTAIGQLSADGVSCVACHAMTDDKFGAEDSFNGGWTLNNTGELYGPHAAPFTRPMEMHTSFVPTEADHILESEQCATCHTLFTETVLPDGSVSSKTFPEQTPYLEWRNSAFAGTTSCQDCHAPKTDVDNNPISTYIAHRPPEGQGGAFPPTSERSPFGRHIFVGGNTTVLQILRDNGDALNTNATTEAFDATIAATINQLGTQTATVEIVNPTLGDGSAGFDVVVHNHSGHKFPTGYPSRRAWLKVTVRDAGGQVLWQSGESNQDGDIVGLSGVEPHHREITSAEQVQIYQSVLGNSEGNDTVALLHAAEYIKDNRLLPRGYSDTHPDHEHTAPIGVSGDPDFSAAQDTTHYAATFDGTAASVEVELVYQALGNRWVRDLLEVPAADVEAFRTMWEATDRRPVLVGSATYP